MKKFLAVGLAVALVLPAISVSNALDEVVISLNDSATTVDGEAISTDAESDVYIASDIVYYMEGRGSSYGAGTANDEHSAAEADKHYVVHITEGGTYRISGTLTFGQVAVETDDTQIVELILDGVNINCTVAPGIIFYTAYNEENANIVATGSAGTIITMADGSDNYVNGGHVAKIYKTGTTKKLHKYDGAVYSKLSLVVRGESAGTGKLTIAADNEGLDSELHMCVESGNIFISSQDDGVNVNEDGISTFIMTGGLLYINAGLGLEGDGVDSNGYMWLNGGTLIAFAHNGADGGIDADSPIIINGGTVIAFGARNDSVDSSSGQPYMELSYSSSKQAGTIVSIFDKATEKPILIFVPLKAYQSFTYSSPMLENNNTYYVLSGGMVGAGTQSCGLYDLNNISFSGGMQQQYGRSSGGPGGGPMGQASGSTDFTITSSLHSFQNVANASTVTFSGSIENTKTEVLFNASILDYLTTNPAPFVYLSASEAVPDEDVQLTVTDYPSENYFASCTLADGSEEIAKIFPSDSGNYLLTIAVNDDNMSYYGSDAWNFTVSEPSEIIMYGDANNDGSVTSADAALILRYVVRLDVLDSIGMANAEVDGDGTVTSADAAKILRWIVKIEQSLQPAVF